MVIPGTSKFKDRRVARVTVPAEAGGLPQETYFLTDQIRTVSVDRFLYRRGRLDNKYVLQALTQVGYFLAPD